MTSSEINEIKDAIALCHHLCDGQPLSGRYYKLLKVVLPVLELSIEYYNVTGYAESIIKLYALDIARVINEKPVMTNQMPDTILDEKGKKDVKIGTKQPTKRTSKMPKPDNRLYVDFPISKARIAELKIEGRVIEKHIEHPVKKKEP